ncbi:TlyA family RNA methyltransferase [Patescibacteria group bacterium]|nr:TlyA family RNA methyltransferase [Patescibacteria group bacterium]
MKKTRLDLSLVERNLVPSRSKAQILVRAGQVFINEQRAVTPAQMVKPSDNIVIKEPLKYVSRGGLKLEHALKKFQIDPTDLTCMDIGASTGGFTDCLLQHGATKIHAIDVGTSQLAEKLKSDPRVISTEQQNFRLLKNLPAKIDLVTIDVSFISLTIILQHLKKLLPEYDSPPSIGGTERPLGRLRGGSSLEIICLLKPQFESPRKYLKKGVIRDPKIHQLIIKNFENFCHDNNFQIINQATSPIKGPKGNTEFLFYLTICKNNLDK